MAVGAGTRSRHSRSWKGLGGPILYFLGAALLLIALFSIWYDWTYTNGGTLTGSMELKAGSEYTITQSGNCPPSGGCLPSSSFNCPYSSSGTGPGNVCNGDTFFHQTGELYGAVEWIVIGAAVLGIVGGIAWLLSSHRVRFRKWALVFGAVALLLALIAPTSLLVGQPTTIHNDLNPPDQPRDGGYLHNGTGPYSSFAGSCSNSSADCLGRSEGPIVATSSWGPDTGWYLSWGASATFLIAFLLSRAGKPADGRATPTKDRPEIEPATAVAPGPPKP